MGINYYLNIGDQTKKCPTCGHEEDDDRLHIGKSSCGWCFSLCVHPDRGINHISDWEKLFDDNPIHDEYGAQVSKDHMMGFITNRSGAGFDDPPHDYRDWEHFHSRNHSSEGPNGLLRHEGSHCVGHGSGTWDYITGDFC